ncbi:hypothetical protein GXW78_07165 [Roseomonas terrae]|uniref:Uncharacterized protein n=1 Tax=Neoroseomonas terrae TaxID=424799 RepID=A0ABS5EFI5_9PROT|nr:hypothetical protein [Neoroseomonas terrae]MBR0649437.1 hypothetical protein [Neoroseomonas terrae]
MSLRKAAWLLILTALCTAAPAVARSGEQYPTRAVVTLPLQDLPPAETLFDRVGRAVTGFIGLFRAGGGAAEAAREAAGFVPGQIRDRDDFVSLMEVAGYGLREIETTIGLIPGSRLTFGRARELSDADRDHVERHLDRHAQRQGGPLSRLQRSIVGAVLSASEIGEMSVERVEIDLYPLPQIKLVLVPRDAPVSAEAGRLMRQIDRLSDRMNGPPPLHGETELQMRRREPPVVQVAH